MALFRKARHAQSALDRRINLIFRSALAFVRCALIWLRLLVFIAGDVGFAAVVWIEHG
jgi:hypothetical protein